MPITLPRVAAPIYRADAGDPITTYTVTPRPPGAMSVNRGWTVSAVAARRERALRTRETAWTTDYHTSPVFSAYPRERNLLLSEAVAQAAAASAHDAGAATPRTKLVLSNVGFCIGDGADGCFTVHDPAPDAPIVSVPGVTPQQAQHMRARRARGDRSPSPTPRSPPRSPARGPRSPESARTRPVPALFEFSNLDADGCFHIGLSQAAKAQPEGASAQQSPSQSQSENRPAGSEDTPAEEEGNAQPDEEKPAPLVWTVVRTERAPEGGQQQQQQQEQKQGDAGAAQANEGEPRDESHAAQDPNPEAEQHGTGRKWLLDEPSANALEAAAAADARYVMTAKDAGLRVTVTFDGDATSVVPSAAAGDPSLDPTTLVFFEPIAEAEGTYRVKLLDVATGRVGALVAVMPPPDDADAEPKLMALADEASATGPSAAFSLRSVADAPATLVLESAACGRRVEEAGGSLRFVGDDPVGSDDEDAARAKQHFQLMRADPTTKPAAADGDADASGAAKKPKKKKAKRRGPKKEYDYRVVLQPLATADPGESRDGAPDRSASTKDAPAETEAAPEQLWGLHPMTATAADGSRLYFLVPKAFPKVFLAVRGDDGTATMLPRPPGDQGIPGNVLVRSRADVIESSKHAPPRAPPKPPAQPKPPRTALQRGEVLEPGSFIAAPGGIFRLSVLHSGNVVLETSAASRKRERAVRAVLRKMPVPPPPGAKGSGRSRQAQTHGPAPPKSARSGTSGSVTTRQGTSGANTARTSTRGGKTRGYTAKPLPPLNRDAAAEKEAATPEDDAPLWQTGTALPTLHDTCGGLRIGDDGELALLLGDADLADPLWKCPALGSLLRVSDEGRVELLERQSVVAKRQKKAAAEATAESDSDSETDDDRSDASAADAAANDDVDDELVVVWTSHGDEAQADEPASENDAEQSAAASASQHDSSPAAESTTKSPAEPTEPTEQKDAEQQSAPASPSSRGSRHSAATSPRTTPPVSPTPEGSHASSPAASPKGADADDDGANTSAVQEKAGDEQPTVKPREDPWAAGGPDPPRTFMAADEALQPGERIVSPNGAFTLVNHTFGVVAIYGDSDTAAWTSKNEPGNPGPLALSATTGKLALVASESAGAGAVWEWPVDGSGATGWRVSDAGAIELVKR